ncbi:hypothetical protein ACHAWF_003210, partial [Thalassiosira exigua]
YLSHIQYFTQELVCAVSLVQVNGDVFDLKQKRASSGYLFGLIPGTVACLISASIAASLSFLVGKTVMRSYVEEALVDYPEFRAVDWAVGKEGFKLMLLLRLSPLFPFALSNYLYGASSVRFRPYFFGTLLGFAPGTFAYVYAGRIGKALTVDVATSEPWYVYAGGDGRGGPAVEGRERCGVGDDRIDGGRGRGGGGGGR